MRVSNEERREVAMSLRTAKQSELWRLSDGELIDTVADAIGVDGMSRHYEAAIFDRLADLIDRPTTTRNGKFKTKYGKKVPCCEICGYSINDKRWGYCPKCGAEVVE